MKLHLGSSSDVRRGYRNCDNRSSSRSRFVPQEVEHVDLNAFPWPFESGSVDEILMIQTLEHLPDTYKVVSEVKRILRPGGHFKGVVPYAFSSAGMNHPQHYRHFTRESFGHLAEDFGFRLVLAKLSNTHDTPLKKLRAILPFKNLLSYLLNNIYDNVEFDLVKCSNP